MAAQHGMLLLFVLWAAPCWRHLSSPAVCWSKQPPHVHPAAATQHTAEQCAHCALTHFVEGSVTLSRCPLLLQCRWHLSSGTTLGKQGAPCLRLNGWPVVKISINHCACYCPLLPGRFSSGRNLPWSHIQWMRPKCATPGSRLLPRSGTAPVPWPSPC